MALKDNLRPASFRGVSFHVESSDIEAGRRTQVHEYPQRDKPYVEDLGRAARGIQITAFLIGADYISQANALLGAVEAKGPGELVHPELGTMTVSIEGKARLSFDAKLGLARVAFTFTESGDLEFPSAGASTQAQSRMAAVDIENAAVDSFIDSFSVDGFQDFVSQEAGSVLTSVFGAVGGNGLPGLDGLGYASRAVSGLQGSLGLLTNPSSLAWTITRSLGISGLAGVGLGWASVIRSLVRLLGGSALSNPAQPRIYTTSRRQVYTNAVAINSLTRQVLLAQAVGASSLVESGVQDETVALRNELVTAIDTECLSASDKVFASLSSARGAVWSDLTERSRDGARLATLTPADTTPAVVLAYNYYGDAAREGEIVTRNAIARPGFVPPEPIKVLSR